MRLVLCDDHRLLLEAMASIFTAHGHVVEAIVTSPSEVIAAVKASDPDICGLDIGFPGAQSGLDVAAKLRHEHPRTKVLILSGTTDPAIVSAAIEAGVAGFTRKDQSAAAILEVLDRVGAGEFVVDADLVRAVAHEARAPRQSDAAMLLSFLTPKERHALAKLVEGRSTDDIARSLGIARSTARTHIQSVLVKLGVHSRLEAAAFVVNEHLLDQLRQAG
jgi:two-component system nitrate/nitrite response regulator NarL